MPTSINPKARDAKYLKLADELRVQLSNGLLKPGDRLPSFVELRTSHQISRGTIEKVHALLEKDGLIIREQGKGVFVATPNRKTSTGIIGFKGGGGSETRSSLYWANLMEGILREAGKNDLQLMLLSDNVEDSVIEQLDGILLAENEDNAYRLLSTFPADLPRLSVMTPVDGISCVLSDDYQGAYDATKHLLGLGHTRIGMLCAGYNHLIENRLQGYQHAYREFGLEPALSWVRQLRNRPNQPDSAAEFTFQGQKTVEEWLRSNWKETGCTAIIAQNDHSAVGAIAGLQAAGLRVPEDISVVGFDGTEMYNFYEPSLTTIALPLREIGSAAIDAMINLITTRSKGVSNMVLPARLKVGKSSATKNPELIFGKELKA